MTLDPELLAQLHDLDRESGGTLLHELVGLFRTQGPERFAAMQAALSAGDARQFAREAHALKGGASALGAVVLQRACGELEHLGKAGQLESAAGRLESAHRAYEVALAALAALV